MLLITLLFDRTRSRVLKHNSRLLRASQEGKEISMELRDQGLTRPKVLILLPFRESALCVVNTISKLLIEEGQVIRIALFVDYNIGFRDK